MNNLHNIINKWLSNPNNLFSAYTNTSPNSIYQFSISPPSTEYPRIENEICLLQQFFIHPDPSRNAEIKKTLYYNSNNKYIDKIILLNEKIYTKEELGVSNSKIIQININKRLTYKDVMIYSRTIANSYIVLANSDIFVDYTIDKIKEFGIAQEKKMYCQLRYEFDGCSKLKNCQLFGDTIIRPDSQDTWIFHTNHTIPDNILPLVDFSLGTRGCDNKFLYLMQIAGYTCYNDPTSIRTYHLHRSGIRNYDNNIPHKLPFHAIYPCGPNFPKIDWDNPFTIQFENTNLEKYIQNKFIAQENFLIPKIQYGIENYIAISGNLLQRNIKNQVNIEFLNNLQIKLKSLKINTGISLNSTEDVIKYSIDYLEAFHLSDCFVSMAACNNRKIPQQYLEFITNNFKKKTFDISVLDIFDSIQYNPWTTALKGKRILIISPIENAIKDKLTERQKIYNIDLFPDCQFIFLSPPQTYLHYSSKSYAQEIHDFVEKIENIKNEFDIALCSCGGYSNPVCCKIYKMGKSAINVGGVLQMYFGIYGNRWITENSDILTIYKNEYWTRRIDIEKPNNYMQLENGCYW